MAETGGAPSLACAAGSFPNQQGPSHFGSRRPFLAACSVRSGGDSLSESADEPSELNLWGASHV